jgi:hypothetical protein
MNTSKYILIIDDIIDYEMTDERRRLLRLWYEKTKTKGVDVSTRDETRKLLEPLSVGEVRDLLTSTLHGAPPKEMLMRIFVTLATWAPIVEANANLTEALESLNESLKHAEHGADGMIDMIDKLGHVEGDIESIRETAVECKTAMSELVRVTDSLLKGRQETDG